MSLPIPHSGFISTNEVNNIDLKEQHHNPNLLEGDVKGSETGGSSQSNNNCGQDDNNQDDTNNIDDTNDPNNIDTNNIDDDTDQDKQHTLEVELPDQLENYQDRLLKKLENQPKKVRKLEVAWQLNKDPTESQKKQQGKPNNHRLQKKEINRLLLSSLDHRMIE